MDIFQLFGKIIIQDEEAQEKIGAIGEKASDLAGKFGSMASVVGKATLAAVGAASAAIVGLTKTSIENYAQYEQLVGGVETLFGLGGQSLEEYAEATSRTTAEAMADWQELTAGQRIVFNNAEKAFQTAGLSANQYMETVTSFSASLIQSLGGDTAKAAEVADRAIIDMSDNANKMGTSMEMIQNAYNGFAKQNYTMLDNLKLGYGGTQEEMQRLIADAAKMTDVQEKLGITVDSSSMSFANIVNAISVMQDSLGIAGATANEAATTIEGSLKMTKAAWKNLITGIADENADLESLIDTFVNSATTAVRNIVPVLAQILGGLSIALEQIIPVVAKELPVLIEELLPGVISGAVALINGLIMALPSVLQILIDQLPSIITQISEALVACFPVLLDTVYGLFGQIWDYISLELLNTGTSFEDMTTKAQETFSKLWEEVQAVWESIGQPIWDMILSCVDSAKGIFEERMPEIKEFVSECFSDIQSFWENNLKPCFEAIGDFIENVLAPVFNTVFSITLGGYVDAGFNIIKDLWENTLKPVFTAITDFLTGVFAGDWEQAMNGYLSIAEGVWNGILTAIETPMETAKEIVNNAIDFIQKKFDFDWSLPHIKLPHFSVSGGEAPWGFGGKGSLPSVGVEWYAKAYDKAMILDDPTIFGYSAASGKMLGGGEGNGNEVVAGESHLMNMIGSVFESKVAKQNEQVITLLTALLDVTVDGNQDMLQALLSGQTFKVGEREFARLVRTYA